MKILYSGRRDLSRSAPVVSGTRIPFPLKYDNIFLMIETENPRPYPLLYSGRRDLNPRPHGPKPCALSRCATPRLKTIFVKKF